MRFGTLIAKMKLSPKDAEVIFDRSEPVGVATDLVMPRHRWFRRPEKKAGTQNSSQLAAH